jgi:hypothetical protein
MHTREEAETIDYRIERPKCCYHALILHIVCVSLICQFGISIALALLLVDKESERAFFIFELC